MEFKLQALSIYEYGQRKDKNGNPHQEDWIYPSLGTIDNEKDRLFILCDGMGGHAAGEVASAAVCEAMSKTINGALEKGEKFSEQLLLEAIEAAYNLLDERDTSEDGQKKMGTTMTFLMLHEGGATIAHIGDSRVYHIRPKTGKKQDVVFCTRDHSLVNDLIKIGEITEEEALNHPQKNVITRAMQPNLEHRYKADIITTKDIRPGDYFYLCSDGMLEQTSDDNLCFMLANDVTDEEKRDMLIKVSKNNRDNHSAHLIHILDVRPASEIGDVSLPACPTSSQAANVDGDVVNPEFDEADATQGAARAEESTNVPASNDEDTKDSQSTKVGQTASSGSPAVGGGTEASATFRSGQGANHKDRGGNQIMWGVLACVAIAVLTLCGILFSKSPEKKDVAQPPAKAVRERNPHAAPRPASSGRKPSDTTVTSPAGQGAAGASASEGQTASQQTSTPNSTAPASAPAATGSSSQSQTATTGTISDTDIQNAIGSKKPEKSENVSSSAENNVKTDANKKQP